MPGKEKLLICANIFKNEDTAARKKAFTAKMAELINQKEKAKTAGTVETKAIG